MDTVLMDGINASNDDLEREVYIKLPFRYSHSSEQVYQSNRAFVHASSSSLIFQI